MQRYIDFFPGLEDRLFLWILLGRLSWLYWDIYEKYFGENQGKYIVFNVAISLQIGISRL